MKMLYEWIDFAEDGPFTFQLWDLEGSETDYSVELTINDPNVPMTCCFCIPEDQREPLARALYSRIEEE